MEDTGTETTGTTETTDSVSDDVSSSTRSESTESGETREASGNSSHGSKEDTTKAQAKAILKEIPENELENTVVTIKVNGKVEKVSAKELQKHYGLEKKAQETIQRAKKFEEELKSRSEQSQKDLIRQITAYAKQNPKAFLQEVGVDPYEFAEMSLAEKLEFMAMSPEQKRALELEHQLREREEKLKSYEQREKEAQEQAKRQAYDQEVEKERQSLDKTFVEAWKESGLPQDKRFGIFMAQEMYASQLQVQKGTREAALTPKEAAAIVKENYLKLTSELVKDLDVQTIVSLLGENGRQKIREYELSLVHGKPAKDVQSSRGGNAQPSKPKGPMSEAEYRKYWESL